MTELLAIVWNIDPEIPFIKELYPVRWYGVLFAAGFIIGQRLFAKFYKERGYGDQEIDKLLIYVVIGIVVGARLGHCLFYDPQYYLLENPLEIFMIWKGGLASHGGGFGLLTALYLYYKKHKELIPSYLWLVDRIAITIALGAFLIRSGNLMNSEIIGKPSDLPWAMVFSKNTEMGLEDTFSDKIEDITIENTDHYQEARELNLPVVNVTIELEPRYFNGDTALINQFMHRQIFWALSHVNPADQHLLLNSESSPIINGNTVQFKCLGISRHPAQFYEALSSLLLFFIILFLFRKYENRPPEGRIFGLFLTYIFTLRIVYEFLKENQVAMEDGWLLNMGQILSIPMILAGIFLLLRKTHRTKEVDK